MTVPSDLPVGRPEFHRPADPTSSNWVGPPPESEGFPYYIATLRANIWLVVLSTLVCVGVALVIIAASPKVYEAEADLLVTPISRDNTTLTGLGLPVDSSDPSRDVETIARLVKTQAVALRTIKALRLARTPAALLKDISATPVASSNVIAITARGESPRTAARIATGFADASVADRTERLHNQLDVLIPRLRLEIADLGSNEEAARDALAQRLRDLQTVRGLKDPTVRRETAAVPNSSPVSPRPVLSLAAAILAGFLIGCGVVLGSQLLDPRLRREEQLRRYRIPILARVPSEHVSRRQAASPLLPDAVSPMTHDAYLLLAATLSGAGGRTVSKRSVLVTGPNPGDGKSTSALNLASAVSSTQGVVLVEADSRRPSLARALGVKPVHGLTNVITGKTPVASALVRAGASAEQVELLVQLPTEPPLAPVLTPTAAEWLVDEVQKHADWVIVDAPPLTLVADALPLAKSVDYVIVVVRLGNTRQRALEELAGLLVQQGVTPAGFVLVGSRRQVSYYGS